MIRPAPSLHAAPPRRDYGIHPRRVLAAVVLPVLAWAALLAAQPTPAPARVPTTGRPAAAPAPGAFRLEGKSDEHGAYAGAATLAAEPDGGGSGDLHLALDRGNGVHLEGTLERRIDGWRFEAPWSAGGFTDALDGRSAGPVVLRGVYVAAPGGALHGKWRLLRDRRVIDRGEETLTPAAAELLVVHGRIFGAPDGATALLIRDHRIAEVGADVQLRAHASPGARVLDADGAHVLPGFHDAHMHLLSGGEAGLGVVLDNETTLAGALAAVKRFADDHPANRWILGRGWQYGIVPRGTYPSRKDLDSVVPDRPVLLESSDGHAGWANTRAFQLAKVTARTADPSNGKIVREADGKTPQGTLLEDAYGVIDVVVPEPDRETRLRSLAAALRQCLEWGITSADDVPSDTETFDDYAALRARHELPIRVSVSPALEGSLADSIAARKKYNDPFLRLGFLKGFVDGVIESKTAYLLKPYAGGQHRGKPCFTPARLDRLVARAHGAGFSVALHAIGDAAVRLSLDAIEHAKAEHPDFAARDRIEHIEVVDPADMPRFAQLGVTASMQPLHADPAGQASGDGAFAQAVGLERLPAAFAWRSLANAGARLAFGSDWPVVTANPLEGLAVACTRQDADGRPRGGWNVSQALSIEEAVRAYTEGPAYALGREAELGKLAPGFLADVVVLAPEVRLDVPKTLWKGKVRWVIVDGEVRLGGE
ncbi:MAG: amidohydrolase [Planctomycetes bacterium]|nr:amidohydrolase [Planctomycetota bacterium]